MLRVGRSGSTHGSAASNISIKTFAIVQRAGYQNSSRSHFEATDIFGTANPQSSSGSGWLGRYLDTLPRPIDSLAAWNTTSETPRSLVSGQTGVPAISNASTYTFASPNRGSAAAQERAAAEAMASNAAPGRPHLAFVNGTSRSAIETIDRAARAMSYTPTVAYPNNGFALALRRWPRHLQRHRSGVLRADGRIEPARQQRGRGHYGGLWHLGDGLAAFTPPCATAACRRYTIIVFSEFGSSISENGSGAPITARRDSCSCWAARCAVGCTARRHRCSQAIRPSRTTPATFGSKRTSVPCTRGCLTNGSASTRRRS